MSHQSSDMGSIEENRKGSMHKGKRRKKGPWEVHYRCEWINKARTGIWRTYKTEEMAKKNLIKFKKETGDRWDFWIVYNKEKDIDGQ